VLQIYIVLGAGKYMNRKLYILGVLGVFLLLTSISFSSAYYYDYYSPKKYNAYSYMSSRDYGYQGVSGYSKTTSYDKYTTEGWQRGQYVKSTHYVKTTRESPYKYGYGYYGNYPYSNYYSYGNSYQNRYYVYDDYPRYGYY
jgi:hypothetical protein